MLTNERQSRTQASKKGVAPTEFAPLSIIRMLWKKRWIALAVFAALAVVSSIVVLELPAVYLAEATVLVDSQKIPERYVSSTVNTDVGDRLATINQQIMSTDRLLKIIDKFNLYSDLKKTGTQEEVIEKMRKDISINLIKGWSGGRPGAFKIGYEGPEASVVASVANQLANLYVEENLKTRETQAEGTADFIDSQVEQAKRKLDELEKQVSEFKSAHTGSLPQQENSLLAMATSAQVQLKGVQDAINRAQQNRTMIETALASAETSEAMMARSSQLRSAQGGATVTASGTVVAAPKKRSEILEEALAQMKLRYSDAYPDVKVLKNELARVKQQEQADEAKAETAKAVAPKEAASSPNASAPAAKAEPVSKELLEVQERVAALRAQLNNSLNELKFQASEQDRLLKLVASYQARIDRLPLVEQQMAALTRDYENSKANYKSLADKKLAAGMATDMERRQQAERFTIIDPARAPEKPVKPNRPLFAGIGAALSLAIGLLLAFGLEFRKSALLGEWELPPDVVVLGRIPPIKMPGKVSLKGATVTSIALIVALCATQRWL